GGPSPTRSTRTTTATAPSPAATSPSWRSSRPSGPTRSADRAGSAPETGLDGAIAVIFVPDYAYGSRRVPPPAGQDEALHSRGSPRDDDLGRRPAGPVPADRRRGGSRQPPVAPRPSRQPRQRRQPRQPRQRRQGRQTRRRRRPRAAARRPDRFLERRV